MSSRVSVPVLPVAEHARVVLAAVITLVAEGEIDAVLALSLARDTLTERCAISVAQATSAITAALAEQLRRSPAVPANEVSP
jgi:hypothetical protein